MAKDFTPAKGSVLETLGNLREDLRARFENETKLEQATLAILELDIRRLVVGFVTADPDQLLELAYELGHPNPAAIEDEFEAPARAAGS